MTSRFLRRLFWLLNRAFMVPAFRLGLGEFMGNPVTGYIMVVKTRGIPVIRIRATGVGTGAGDPGGWLWILVAAAVAWLIWRGR